MRIMHLSRASETLRWFLIPTMRAQQALGHEVLVCARAGPDAEFLREQGFEVYTHDMHRSQNPLNAIATVLTIRRVLVRRKIEGLVCHTSLGALVGRLAAWLAGTPRVVYFVHGLACGQAQGPLAWQLRFQIEKLLAPLTDAVIVMNDYDERLARKTPLGRSRDSIYRIPGMGVDLTRFTTTPDPVMRDRLCDELGVARARKLVFCVARLIPEKGVREFIAAAARLSAARDDTTFLLAGTGPLHDELTQTLRRAGLERQVRILGWRTDVDGLMKSADLFVLPSYFMEGLPVSILEAMASGKPVVSTFHKGCEDAVANGVTGLLVPSRQVDPLVKCVARLLDDAELRARMGQAGRQRAEERFELGACTAQIVGLLERVLREPSARSLEARAKLTGPASRADR